jgi:hypothetical protein
MTMIIPLAWYRYLLFLWSGVWLVYLIGSGEALAQHEGFFIGIGVWLLSIFWLWISKSWPFDKRQP